MEKLRGVLGRAVSLKVWHLAVIVVVAIGLGGAVGASNDGEQATLTAADEPASTTTTEERTTTTARRVITRRPTTTTTTPPPTAEELAAAFPGVFEATRPTLFNIVEHIFEIETVDKLVYNQGEQAIELAVTSTYSSEDNQHEAAWTIIRGLAGAWTENGLGKPAWQPSFILVNSGRRYECSGPFMVQLNQARASQAGWEAACA